MHASDSNCQTSDGRGRSYLHTTEAHVRGEMGECDVLTNLQINFPLLVSPSSFGPSSARHLSNSWTDRLAIFSFERTNIGCCIRSAPFGGFTAVYRLRMPAFERQFFLTATHIPRKYCRWVV